MNEPFYLTITYQGRELELRARFERWGFTYRISVLVGEETFVFEPDEEGGYRVLRADTASQTAGPERDLLNAICEKLKTLGDLS